jgi:hypothetical protein
VPARLLAADGVAEQCRHHDRHGREQQQHEPQLIVRERARCGQQEGGDAREPDRGAPGEPQVPYVCRRSRVRECGGEQRRSGDADSCELGAEHLVDGER